MDNGVLAIQRGPTFCVAHTKSPQSGVSALLTRIHCSLLNEPPHLRGIHHVLEHVFVRHLVDNMARRHPGSGDIRGSTDHDGIQLVWSGPSTQMGSYISELGSLLKHEPNISDHFAAREITRVRTERQLKEADPFERAMGDMGRLIYPGTSLAKRPDAVGRWIDHNPVAEIRPALAGLRRSSGVSFSLATDSGALAELGARQLVSIGEGWGSLLGEGVNGQVATRSVAHDLTGAKNPIYVRPERRGLSSVSVGFKDLPISDPRSAHIHILSDALRYVVEAQTSHGQGITYEAPRTFYLRSREGGAFGLSLRCLDEAILPVVSVIEDSLELLARGPMPDLIFSRIVRSNLIHRIQEPAQTAHGAALMAEMQATDRPFFGGFNELAASAQSISRTDLRATAKALFSSATILLHAKAVPLMLSSRTEPVPDLNQHE